MDEADTRRATLRETLRDSDAGGARGFAAAQLGELRDEASVPDLVGLLGDPDRGLAESAQKALIDIGGERVARSLLPLLRSEDLSQRNLAIVILESVGDDAVPAVAELIGDDDPDVRLFALEILLQIGRAGVLEPMVQALEDENVNVATAAARALGALGEEAAVPHLAAALEGPAWLACAAVTSLGQIGGEPALAALLSIPDSAPGTVRFTSLGALAEHGSPAAIPFLQSIVATSPKPLKDQAIQSIIRILDQAYEAVVEDAAEYLGLETLIGFLRSKSLNTVLSAVRLLGRIERPGVEDALLELLAEDDRELTPHLTDIFQRRGVTNVRRLVRMLDDVELSYQCKKAVIEILSSTHSVAAIDSLIAHLKYGDEGLSVDLVHGLSGFDRGDAHAAIIEATRSQNEFVRCAVADVVDPTRSEVEFDGMVRLLGDTSQGVRRRAVERCQVHMGAELKRRLRNVLDAAEEPVLESVITVLSPAMSADILQRVFELGASAGPLLFTTVVRCLVDNRMDLDPEMREAAAELLRQRSGDASEDVRVAVAKGWRHFGASDQSGPLLALVRDDESDRVRYEAALSLSSCEPGTFVEALLGMLNALPPYVQTAAIETLAGSGGDRVKSELRDLLPPDHVLVVSGLLEEALGAPGDAR